MVSGGTLQKQPNCDSHDYIRGQPLFWLRMFSPTDQKKSEVIFEGDKGCSMFQTVGHRKILLTWLFLLSMWLLRVALAENILGCLP